VDGARALRRPQRGQTIGTFVERCRFVQVHAAGWLLLPLHVCSSKLGTRERQKDKREKAKRENGRKTATHTNVQHTRPLVLSEL
jgi:hypothetical protein